VEPAEKCRDILEVGCENVYKTYLKIF